MPRIKSIKNLNKHFFRIKISGAVQGVGFRPFIYRLANGMRLTGWVSNTTQGVLIEVAGERDKVYEFISRIYDEKPSCAVIESLKVEEIHPFESNTFEIRASKYDFEKEAFVLPELATCSDCIKELFNSKDRRYLYPFINCTQCGPRFTIIQDIPYDRKNTTMQEFEMCQRCLKEYHNPKTRRFHAQPNACWDCGPEVVLSEKGKILYKGNDAIQMAAQFLKEEKIIAIKSLGGYQLACDARNQNAVLKLRKRKRRIAKPFALMAKDLKMILNYCEVNQREKEILTSASAPIVLLRKKEGIDIADAVAPHQKYLGFMLPYTPLHHLLFRLIEFPLVMTSGNITEEPIYYKDEEAQEKLKDICDYFLTHNRKIYIRCDDSVTRIFISPDGKLTKEYIIRRARGYAPYPITLNYKFKTTILALGGFLKNTFCFAKNNHAFLSHHIGDLDNKAAIDAFQEGIRHYARIFQIQPEVIVVDEHPEYYSTGFGIELAKEGKKLIKVQHHHAHIVSCMVENDIKEEIIGIAFDGTGFGRDGNIWGSEIIISDLKYFERVAHLEYFPLAGGESAIKKPWQMGFSLLYHTYDEELFNLRLEFLRKIEEDKKNLLSAIIKNRINTPLTSGMGRLFAGVSAILNICLEASYEAQAEMELEAIADESVKESYCPEIKIKDNTKEILISTLIKEIVSDIAKGLDASWIAGKFHNWIVESVYLILREIKKKYKLNKVCLSGGVFQNMLLLKKLYQRLINKGFQIYLHGKVPANDGGIALGQAVIANEWI